MLEDWPFSSSNTAEWEKKKKKHPSLFSELLPSHNTSVKNQHKTQVESVQAETRPGFTWRKAWNRSEENEITPLKRENKGVCGCEPKLRPLSYCALLLGDLSSRAQDHTAGLPSCFCSCKDVPDGLHNGERRNRWPRTHRAPPHHSYKLQSVPCYSLCCCAELVARFFKLKSIKSRIHLKSEAYLSWFCGGYLNCLNKHKGKTWFTRSARFLLYFFKLKIR